MLLIVGKTIESYHSVADEKLNAGLYDTYKDQAQKKVSLRATLVNCHTIYQPIFQKRK